MSTSGGARGEPIPHGQGPERNDAILSLLQVARATGTQWEDTLPLPTRPPSNFTTPQPLLRPHRQ
ncbi:MAG: hypothetical protein V8S34_02270 [Lawsonibacter sp.]